MTPKQRVLKMAADLGAVVDQGRHLDGIEVTVTAPDGFHFAYSGVHELVSSQAPDECSVEVWRDLRERMNEGLEACDGSENCLAWNGEI